MSLKKIITMIIVIAAAAVIFIFAMGGLRANAPFSDIFSLSKAQAVTENGADWTLMQPENSSRTPYFTKSDSVNTSGSIAMRGYLYTGEYGDTVRKADCLPYSDNHFLFGQLRWYLPPDIQYGKIRGAYCKLAWRSSIDKKIHTAYISTPGLTKSQIQEATIWCNAGDMEKILKQQENHPK